MLTNFIQHCQCFPFSNTVNVNIFIQLRFPTSSRKGHFRAIITHAGASYDIFNLICITLFILSNILKHVGKCAKCMKIYTMGNKLMCTAIAHTCVNENTS